MPSFVRIVSLLLPAALFFAPAAFPASDPSPSAGPLLTLRDSVAATLLNHKSLKAMQENREAVAEELNRAWAFYGPRLDISAGAGAGVLNNATTRALRDTGVTGADSRFYPATNIGLTLTQPLYDGFATRSRVRSAQSTLDSMRHRVLDNAAALALDAIVAHVDLLRQREIVRLAGENLERHREILVLARDRSLSGADDAADLTQAENRLARAMSSMVEARSALADSEETYFRLTAALPSERLSPAELPGRLYAGPEEVLEEAMRLNPKLAAYLEDVMSARADGELARAAFHPSFALEAGPGYTNRHSRGSQWTYSFDVMVNMNWNIFNSGADEAGFRASQARVRQSRQLLHNFADDLGLEIKNTSPAYTTSREQHRHYQDAAGFSESTCASYEDQFSVGQRSLLDVLDGYSELFSASTQVVTAQGNIVIGAWRLLAVAGGLLSGLEIDDSFLLAAPAPAPEDPREAF